MFYFYQWGMTMFGSGINKELTKSMLGTMPRRDQTQVLQDLYNKGYSVPEIAKATDIPAPTIYNRIEAHRGRSNQDVRAT